MKLFFFADEYRRAGDFRESLLRFLAAPPASGVFFLAAASVTRRGGMRWVEDRGREGRSFLLGAAKIIVEITTSQKMRNRRDDERNFNVPFI